MKRIAVVTILALMLVLAMPLVSLGASTLYIDITATGSELDISDNVAAWDVGVVSANDNKTTAITWGSITNNTSTEVTIRVYGNDMKDAATGSAKTWTLATAIDAATFAMKVGLDDDDDTFDIVVKKYGDTPYNTLLFNADATLDADDSWDYGLNFLAPSSSVGNEAMIMCDVAGSETDDADNGLVFVAEAAA